MPTRIRVSAGSGILSEYQGRFANESERTSYIASLRDKRDYYTLSLLRESGWVVCIFDMGHGRPCTPFTDCLPKGRVLSL